MTFPTRNTEFILGRTVQYALCQPNSLILFAVTTRQQKHLLMTDIGEMLKGDVHEWSLARSRVELTNGSVIKFVTSNDPDAIRGLKFDLASISFDEHSQEFMDAVKACSKEVFE